MSRFFLPLLLALACASGVRAAEVVAAARTEPDPPARSESDRTAINPRYTGSPFITTWTAEDYGAAPVNWRVVFNPANGFVYVGNNYGVLEFDGATWRLIELTDHSAVLALAVDAHGRIWAGGTSELCWLTPDATGALQAVSVRDRLPPEERETGSILFAAAAPDGMYFASATKLYFFADDGRAHVWPAQPRINGLWSMDGAVHAAMSDGGVFRLRDGALARVDMAAPLNEPTTSSRRRAYAARPDGAGGWVLLTGFGPVHWSGPGAGLTLLSEESAAPFRGEQANAAAFLADGRIAYATTRSGLLVFDRAGRLVQRVARADGLPANRIEHLAEDAEGGLWLVTRTSLARVQLDSPFAVHGRAQGFDGSPRAIDRLGDRLFLTHSEGVAWRDADGQFHDFTGPRLGMNKLFALDDRMIATGPTLRELRADGSAPLLLRHTFSPMMRWARDPARLIAGGIDGLSLLTRLPDGALRDDGFVKQAPLEIRELLDGGDGWVWGVTVEGRVWRADFRGGLKLDAPVEIFNAAHGLPDVRHRDNAKLFRLGGEVVVASAAWVKRFDPATGHFVPETRLADPAIASGAVATEMDKHGELWLRSPPPAQQFFHLVTSGPPPWRAIPLASSPLAALVANDLYHDEALHTLWISGQGAFVSLDLDWQRTQTLPPLRAFVRRVRVSDSAVPLAGALNAQPSTLHLVSTQNSLTIDFAAPTFAPDYRGKLLTVYRTRLEGLETEWTPWSADPHREFLNLPYRALTFHVQARALDGRESAADARESTLAFSIAPPWWQAPWAWAVYVMLAALGLGGIVLLRTQALHQRAAVLEHQVAERTVELHARNQELARLHRLELDEKTSARLGEQRALLAEEQARLEMLRYQLNPHFLFNALASISGLAVAQPAAARAMIGKLSEFCRLSLARGRGDTTTLADEFKMLGLYLEVEKARWEESLLIEFALDERVRNLRLPAFLLLPLVENAVKYGSQTSGDVLHVRVIAREAADGAIEIEIANTGEWVTEGAATRNSTHIGLDNLRERLARAFPDRHRFTIDHADGWVRVKLTLQT